MVLFCIVLILCKNDANSVVEHSAIKSYGGYCYYGFGWYTTIWGAMILSSAPMDDYLQGG